MFACGLLWIFKPFHTSKTRWCWSNEGTSRLCLFKLVILGNLACCWNVVLTLCGLCTVNNMELKSLHYCKTGVLSRYSYTIFCTPGPVPEDIFFYSYYAFKTFCSATYFQKNPLMAQLASNPFQVVYLFSNKKLQLTHIVSMHFYIIVPFCFNVDCLLLLRDCKHRLYSYVMIMLTHLVHLREGKWTCLFSISVNEFSVPFQILNCH